MLNRRARRKPSRRANDRRLRAERLEDRQLLTGVVAGVKWNDLDADSIRDAGEPGLGGVQIYADTNGNSKFDVGEPMRLTAADGSYQLPLSPGTYTIRETVPSGWVQTAPAIGSYTFLIHEGETLSGRDFGNRTVPSGVAGSKWNDLNGNGLREEGESGLGGWQIYADLNSNHQFDPGEPMTLTAGDGSYELSLTPGDYTIRETVLPGWVQTAPLGGSYTFTLAQGETLTGRDFGNRTIPSGVTGVKWEDLDGDGVQDSGELGLADWQIYADTNGNSQFDPGEPMVLTAGDGSYTLNLVPATYTIRETLVPGWQQTAPLGGSYSAKVDQGVIAPGYDFGNRPVGKVTGLKWNDLDQDGLRDVGEPGLAGWQIYADTSGNHQFDSGEPMTLTAGDGSYEMALVPGTYQLRETLVSGWVQTAPVGGSYTFTLAQGATLTGRDFGNWTIPSGVAGVKWEDLDGDGAQDSGELGLADWQIYADMNGSSQFDPGEPMVLTAGDGSYTLRLEPGTYTIRETLVPGWKQTAPLNGSYAVTVSAGVIAPGYDFGNQFIFSKVTGVKWNDLDADGLHDANEPGLADWQIYADLNNNSRYDSGEPMTLTTGDGSYELQLSAGSYIVRETFVSGWFQTAPPNGFYAVPLGPAETVTSCDFGNVDGLVAGLVWNDSSGNGLRETGEPGLAGWRVYADINQNGHFDSWEPSATSTADGSYALPLSDGTYVLREATASGWRQTAPPGGSYTITVIQGVTLSGRDFGNQSITASSDAATPSLYDPDSSVWYLRSSASTGSADCVFGYGQPGAGWLPVAGDWDGNGTASIGLYDPQSSLWYLRDTNSAGRADCVFGYGPAKAGWIPVVGDWDGNGTRTVGLYDPSASTWYLRNSNTAGTAEIVFGFGPPGAGWIPVVGDWGGNGTETIGLYDPSASIWYLRNANSTGAPGAVFGYGQPGAGWTPVTGDWNARAGDSIGLVDAQCVWSLRDSNSAGTAEAIFGYGQPGAGWIPVTGDWGGAGAALLAAADPANTVRGNDLVLDQLQPVVAEAVRRYAAAGLGSKELGDLATARVAVADLPGPMLGLATRDAIYLDTDAAGHGWFIDRTPAVDEEFAAPGDGRLQAIDPAAVDRIDLLSVVEHELGHLAGLRDLDAGESLMSGRLSVGVRRTVGPKEIDAVIATSSP